MKQPRIAWFFRLMAAGGVGLLLASLYRQRAELGHWEGWLAFLTGYALPAVQALQRAGVISGMPDGSFRPRDTATREQACVVLCLL